MSGFAKAVAQAGFYYSEVILMLKKETLRKIRMSPVNPENRSGI